jgi:hypothetical protein
MLGFTFKQITAIIIVFGGLMLVFYDIFALFVLGADNTISAVINQWAFQAPPLLVFVAGSVFGGLAVHFLGWAPLEKMIKKDDNEKV